MWDSRVLQLLENEESQCMLSCQFKNCEDNNTWIFTSVYRPTIGEERVQFWEVGCYWRKMARAVVHRWGFQRSKIS